MDVKLTNCNSSNMLSILHFQNVNCNSFWKYYTGLSNQKSGGFGNGGGKISSFVEDGSLFSPDPDGKRFRYDSNVSDGKKSTDMINHLQSIVRDLRMEKTNLLKELQVTRDNSAKRESEKIRIFESLGDSLEENKKISV